MNTLTIKKDNGCEEVYILKEDYDKSVYWLRLELQRVIGFCCEDCKGNKKVCQYNDFCAVNEIQKKLETISSDGDYSELGNL